MAINPNTNFTAGAILTAAQQNRFPRGVMAYASNSVNSGITTIADITGLSVTWTAVAGRNYMIQLMWTGSNSTGPAIISSYITTSANVKVSEYLWRTQTNNDYIVGNQFAIVSPSAGSVTYKARAESNGGTLTVFSNAVRPEIKAQIIVLDIGPA